MSLRAEIVRLGLRAFVKGRSRPDQTIDDMRRRMAGAMRFVPVPPGGVRVREVDAGGIAAERILPRAASGDRHILYLHGGGYVGGSPEVYRPLVGRIAEAAGAELLCPDYRLAPEHPFPAALDDAVAVYEWLLAEGIAPQRLAVAGDSAGGGLAFALLLRLRDMGRPLPAAVAALSPWTDLALTGASLQLHAAADPMLHPQDVAPVANWYLAGADPRHPWASPLYGDPSGLPPALIQVGGDEILHDDAIRMADRLRAAGGIVELEVWPRMPHVWHLFAAVMPEARRAIGRIGRFFDNRW